MKLLKCLFILLVAISLVISISSMPLEEENQDNINDEVVIDDDIVSSDEEVSSGHGGAGRFLAQKKIKMQHLRLRCNKIPRICHVKGSPGPNCCKKKCVNVMNDRYNCGACGKKCRHSQICCKGKCVNPYFNGSHCGGCSNRCQNGGFCAFGLCNYA